MKIFVIADASKRKAKPVGVLLWEPDDMRDQGRFAIELSAECDEDDLPLSLSFFRGGSRRCASADQSEAWVRSRIVPEDRHNIVEILRANGLTCYDEVSLLAACQGRSSDDDLRVYEISWSDESPENMERLVASLGAASVVGDSENKAARTRADLILSTVERRREGGEIRYAFVGLSQINDSEQLAQEASSQTAAYRVGSQIRKLRLAAGLTQTQLAQRAGITQSVLSRVESGTGNPTLALLSEIAGALGQELTISVP